MTPKYSPILWWPLKISKKSSYPENHFSENHKNDEIQNFGRKKMTQAYVYMKISKNPLGTALFLKFPTRGWWNLELEMYFRVWV